MNGGKGLSHEKTDAFYKEIKEKFHGEGFDTDRTGCTSQAMYLVKGKTRLYVHPMEISGYCETLHIPQITAILKKRRPYIPSCKGYDSGRGVFLHR